MLVRWQRLAEDNRSGIVFLIALFLASTVSHQSAVLCYYWPQLVGPWHYAAPISTLDVQPGVRGDLFESIPASTATSRRLPRPHAKPSRVYRREFHAASHRGAA